MEWLNALPDSKTQVTFNDETITCKRPSGLTESVKWSQLQMVLLMTTSDSPIGKETLWILEGGEAGCVIPAEAIGIDLLLARLQQLPGFENPKASEAAGETGNRQFICWRKEPLT